MASFIPREQLTMNTQEIISKHQSSLLQQQQQPLNTMYVPQCRGNSSTIEESGNIGGVAAAAATRNLQHSLFNISTNTGNRISNEFEDSGKRCMIDASSFIKKTYDEVKQSQEMSVLRDDFNAFTMFNIKCQFGLLNEYKKLFTNTKILSIFIINLYDEKYGGENGLLTKYPSLQFYINFIVISVINGFNSRFSNLNNNKEKKARFSKINILKKRKINTGEDEQVTDQNLENNVSDFEKTEYYTNFKRLYAIGEYTKWLVPSCFAATCVTINQNIVSRRTKTGVNISENGLECNFLTPIFCRIYFRKNKDNEYYHLDGMREIKSLLLAMIPGSGTDVDMFQLGSPRNPKLLCVFTNDLMEVKQLHVSESETLFTIINDLPVSLHCQGNKKILQTKTYSSVYYILKDKFTELTEDEEKSINNCNINNNKKSDE